MKDKLIEIKSLSKVYYMGANELQALKSISLTINKGEFVSIMGTSGSGKSTLMNILGCLDKATYGDYFLEGIDIKDKTEDELSFIRNQKIGFVFQSFNLISRTSALKNVELPMIYAKKDAAYREKRAQDLLTRVGLGDRLYHVPNELSGGQRQRVAIARALANEPPIILADEPTGNLDSKSGTEIMNLFKDLHREGKTVIIVTHEREIAEFTDRIVTFKDGSIINDERRGDKDADTGKPQAGSF